MTLHPRNTAEAADDRGRRHRDLGALLEAEWRAQGLSAADLGRQADVNPSTISRWRRGLTTPRSRPLGRVLRALNPGAKDTGRWIAITEALADLGLSMSALLARSDPVIQVDRDEAEDRGSSRPRDWNEAYQRASELLHAGLAEPAIPLLQQAQRLAFDDDDRAAALSEESWALWRLATDEDQFQDALDVARLALRALGLTTLHEAYGERVPPAEPVVKRLGAQRRLKLYGRVAVMIGQVYLRQERYELAKPWLERAYEIGQALDDPQLLWSGQHFQMRCDFARATRPAPPELISPSRLQDALRATWVPPAIADRRRFAQTARYFALDLDPQRERDQAAGHLTEAHQRRFHAQYHRVAHDHDAAARENAAARALFAAHPGGPHPDIGHIDWVEAQLAMGRDETNVAKQHLQMALMCGQSMKYAKMAADALRSLGQLGLLATDRDAQRLGLKQSIASVLAYPLYLERWEGELAIAAAAAGVSRLAVDAEQWWRTLRPTLEEDILLNRPPFDEIVGLRPLADPLPGERFAVATHALNEIEDRIKQVGAPPDQSFPDKRQTRTAARTFAR